MDPERSFGRTILVLLALTIVLHLAGARSVAANDSLWGVHVYAFLPFWILAVATFALVLVVVLARNADAPIVRAVDGMAARAPLPRRWAYVVVIAVSLFAGGIFWLCRARHTFLGDGDIIAALLPTSPPFHRRACSAFINYHCFNHGAHVKPDVAQVVVQSRRFRQRAPGFLSFPSPGSWRKLRAPW